jgi:xylose dehydrogenase (NAD/NADP)
MADSIQWGILGNATIARKCVLPAIRKSRNGHTGVLGSRRPEQASRLMEALGIGRVVDQYQAVLDDPSVDAVYIPLPNHLHCPWTIRALNAGKHVLCEKPLACTAREAREMAAAARSNGRVLMEALMYRFHPRSQQIKTRVDRGDIGRPALIQAAFTFPLDETVLARGDNVRLQPETGGGALLDVGCYAVSTARWLMGREPVAVQGVAARHENGVDLLFAGVLDFGGQALATFEAGFIAALQQTYRVVGRRGAIELPHNAYIPYEADAGYALRGLNEEQGLHIHVGRADEYQLMVEYFADVVLNGAPAIIPPEESIENMRVLDALAEAATSGHTVRIRPQGGP